MPASVRALAALCATPMLTVACATSPVQQARDADDALNTTYQQLLDGLSGPGEASLKRAQRAWIAYRDRTCAFEARIGDAGDDWISEDTARPLDPQCIARLTRERLAHLERYAGRIDDISSREATAPTVVAAGKAGLKQLVERDKLRRARPGDFEAWIEAAAPGTDLDPAELPGRSHAREAYVVLDRMRYPDGLAGADAVTFLVAPGVPEPRGDRGHSIVYFLEDGTCQGIRCPSTD